MQFLKIYFINTETVGSHTSSGRDSLHVARRQRKRWRQFDCPKLITRRVRIARRLVTKISPHHALPNRSPVGIPRGGRHHCFSWILHRGLVPDADLIISSGEVQSELFTEENTCMTSSEDNRVSIPPKRSEIGLSVSRSCDSSQ